MHRLLYGLLVLLFIPMTLLALPASATEDCEVSPDIVAGVRLLLTGEDATGYFDIWSPDEIACACIEIYYNDPEDGNYHDRVVTGAVVLLGQTGDPRAVPVLIDAIDTHPAQALYNLGNFPTVDAVNALAAHVGDENFEARENAAEGLRNMLPPGDEDMEDGWVDALDNAISVVSEWIPDEPEEDIREYFVDALTNLQNLKQSAISTGGVE
jgi:hypothetical protein